ncbi:MAG: sigma-70 family RNA polymerase sigma factor [Verrucomicrobiota bacterium]
MDSQNTRVTLIGRLRDLDDADAWSEFVGLYGPVIINFCRKRGVADHDIEDISQEVLSALSQAIRNFEYDPKKGTFRSWMYRFVRNRLSRHWRWRDRHPDRGSGRTTVRKVIENQPGDDDLRFEQEWETDYRRRLFAWACSKVEPEVAPVTWEAFQLFAVKNLPVDAVAKQLDIKPGAVYVAKSRVVSRIRETVAGVTEGWDPDLDVLG